MPEFRSLLPPNATRLERDIESATERLGNVPVPIDTLWDPQRCPAELLPWLAWALSVDEWDSTWPEDVQRATIAASIEIHRRKGTVWAVKRALAALDVSADLIEWWQKNPAGQPHTFDLIAWVNDNLAGGATMLAPETYDLVARLVDAYKPARSHYTFRVGARFDQGLAPVVGSELDQVARWQAEARHQIPGIGNDMTVVGGGQLADGGRWQAETRAPLQIFASKPVTLAQAAEHPISIVRVPMEAV